MQQASSREMEGGGMNSMLTHSNNSHSQVSLEDLQPNNGNGSAHFVESQNSHHHDDFLEQMLSTIPNCPWPPHDHHLSNPNHHHQLSGGGGGAAAAALKSGTAGGDSDPSDDPEAAAAFHYPTFDDSSTSLASKLRHHQINGATKSLLLQQHLLRSAVADSGLLPLPLRLGNNNNNSNNNDSHLPSQNDVVDPSPFKSPGSQGGGDGSVQALYNGFPGSLHGNGQHFHPAHQAGGGGGSMPGQNYGGQGQVAAAAAAAPPASASTGTGGSSGAAPQRQRVRARRGQATDPHSIAERLRRERIAERMKALQELVPNANKTDKASMLDEIIDYVKFLQLQVKVLSMSRLGGAAAVAPLVADMSSEGCGGGVGRNSNGGGNTTASTNDSSMTVTEHQVAKLMEEDMGSAMQYLQGKGLCLMPISLATAISTATCHPRNPLVPTTRPNTTTTDTTNNNNAPASPNLSVLTSSATAVAADLKDSTPSLSNP